MIIGEQHFAEHPDDYSFYCIDSRILLAVSKQQTAMM